VLALADGAGLAAAGAGRAAGRASAGLPAAADIQQGFERGEAYYSGEGVPQDCIQAFQWFQKAAEQDHVVAQLSLGVMYDAGRGVA